LSNLSAAQIEALAKVRESEVKARDDKVEFMKEIEDRERGDAYRRQELDAKLMDAAKPVSAGAGAGTGAKVRKCPHCGSMVPVQAKFCGECGKQLIMTDTDGKEY
jgi:Double zinc ribbon